MLKAAIEKIQDLSTPIIREIEGRTFCFTSAGDMSEVRPTIDSPATLTLSSLDALVKLVQTEALKSYKNPIYITVPTHLTVNCFAQPDFEGRYERITYYQANATDVPGWDTKNQLGFEEAMIALRARIQPTPDAEYTLKLLSDITTGAKVTCNDNGIATTVVTKRGVELQASTPIRPIVSLKPYRTFQEVEQPASEFLIRVSERGIAFIEADGGMWKLSARQIIKAYFEDKLAGEIASGLVVVAL